MLLKMKISLQILLVGHFIIGTFNISMKIVHFYIYFLNQMYRGIRFRVLG